MPKDVFEFDCPCCGKPVEVNVRTGRARASNFEQSKKGRSFDGLIAETKRDGERLADLFDSARDQQERQREMLDERFRDAAKRAEQDPRKPTNPFDME
jgi:hypothetical protein